MFHVKRPRIEFMCADEEWGAIPAPVEARKVIPAWFKKLPDRINNEERLRNSTIKRCMPFLDALSVGWIIPLAADVEIVSNDDASGFSWRSNYSATMIEEHGYEQISTEAAPHPALPKPPMKWINRWLMRVPRGYSILFTPPLNREGAPFTCLSGLVDCDGYFEIVNFPFFFHEKNFTGIIRAGTPLVQAIPIRRDTLLKADVRRMTSRDHADLVMTRKRRSLEESLYRDKIWSKK
jgi:hypothetical protein